MDYKAEFEKWLKAPALNEEGRRELESVKGDEKAVEYRFGAELEFGTAGMRGIIGCGMNMMNVYTVMRATQGLCEYIDPEGAEAKALEAEGYTRTDWGVKMVEQRDQLWDYNILSGIENSDVPLYFHPIPLETIQQSGGGVSNGYGLPQQ